MNEEPHGENFVIELPEGGVYFGNYSLYSGDSVDEDLPSIKYGLEIQIPFFFLFVFVAFIITAVVN